MRFPPISRQFVMALCCSLPWFAGCGGSNLDPEGRVKASGTVTLDGSPLEKGTVTFVDDQGSSVAVGIVEKGSFKLSKSANLPGIPPGNYQVSISAWKVAPGSVNEAGDIVEKGEPLIPLPYMDHKTSKLTAEVPAGGASDLTFALTSMGP